MHNVYVSFCVYACVLWNVLSMFFHLITEYDFTADSNNDQKHLSLDGLRFDVFQWTTSYFQFNAIDKKTI